MASVSNIALAITNGASSTTRNLTVTGTMNFDAGDVGKSYRLEIKVMGEDKSGDKLPSGDAIGDDELKVYTWGTFLKWPYKQFQVAAAGTQNFSETRSIEVAKLDEDTGWVKIADADINTPVYMPRQDEVYARVVLSGAPTTARSPTVIAGIGV